MGVSGSGKTTVAEGIARATGMVFAEADEFHSEANIAKMRAGRPLKDADRWRWLEALSEWMRRGAVAQASTVMACSALRRAYRDVLRSGLDTVDFIHPHWAGRTNPNADGDPRGSLHAGRPARLPTRNVGAVGAGRVRDSARLNQTGHGARRRHPDAAGGRQSDS
jgi:hypothetical protein